LQYSPLQRGVDVLSGKSAAIVFELRWVDRYHVPDETSGRRLMQPLAAAVEHNLLCS